MTRVYHNYKGLPFKEANKQFIKDYRLKYLLLSRFTYWGKCPINIRKLNIVHIKNIVSKFGNTYMIKNHPLIFYRYLKNELKKR